MIPPDGFPAVDKVLADALVPDGCVLQGFIVVATWIDAEGESRWQVYDQLDSTLSSRIGLLEMAKAAMLTCSGYMDDGDGE